MKNAGGLDRPAQVLQPAAALDFGPHHLAGELHGAARHHRLPRGRAGAGGSDRRVGRADQDAIDTELRADDLRHDGIEPLAHLDRGGLHFREGAFPIDRDPHPRLGRVVEALAVTEVLVPHGDADAAFEPLAVADVTGTARQGGLLVKTAVPSSRALGTSYGPAAKVVALPITAGDVEV